MLGLIAQLVGLLPKLARVVLNLEASLARTLTQAGKALYLWQVDISQHDSLYAN